MQRSRAMNALRNTLPAALLCAPLFACGGPGGLPKFNEATIETVSGWVTEVDPFVRLERNTRNGVRVKLETDDGETFDVFLGPATYLDHHGIRLERGDEISVTGSKVRYEDHDAIIATVVDEDGDRVKLRDADGHQAWRGLDREK
jgi:hypothetical protein